MLFISTQFVALANTNETTHKESLVEEVEHEAKEVEHEVKSELHTEGDLPKDVTAYVMNSIMTHVADANEYHIATIDHKHIVLPLPCILINKETKKVSVFMSSKLHKVHEYDGYAINHETGRVIDAKTHDRSTFYDLSITKNVFHMILGFIVLALIFFKVKNAYEVRPNQAPRGLQGFMEPLIKYLIDDVIKQNIPHHDEKYTVFILCIFFFILINNLLGLVPFFPGSANLSGNIAFTMTLAIFAGIMINFNGTKGYWKHIFAMPGVPKPVLLILTPIEILGVILKPLVLMLRLFGNITGGHIAVLSIVSLIFILGDLGRSVGGTVAGSVLAVPILLFVNAMELFVAFLQAYVFTLLTAIFIGMAVEEADHH